MVTSPYTSNGKMYQWCVKQYAINQGKSIIGIKTSEMLLILTGCDANPFGVDNAKKTIPDAQMSAHYTFSNHFASNGRLHSSDGWIGESTASWLQVGYWTYFS